MFLDISKCHMAMRFMVLLPDSLLTSMPCLAPAGELLFLLRQKKEPKEKVAL
jgi:hypothetical protein